MLTRLEISFGGGRARLEVDVLRDGFHARERRLGRLALLLVMPIALVIVVQSVGLVTGWYSLDRLMNAPGAPWVYVLTAGTMGAVLAIGIVVASRLRIVVGRREASRVLTVTLRVTAPEGLALGIATGLLALFLAHLAADGLACARGVAGAC